MYTPVDRENPLPDTTDRPYAGVLLFGYALRLQNDTGATELTISAGVIGPAAGAGGTQSWIHRNLAHRPVFHGWSNQIPNSVVVDAEYSRRHRYVAPLVSGLGFDVTPVGGVAVGNLMDYGRAGIGMRFGYHLTPAWGEQHLTPTVPSGFRDGPRPEITADYQGDRLSDNFELGLTSSAETRAVLYNATLDRTPQHVLRPWESHEPFILEGSVGGFARLNVSRIGWPSLPDLTVTYTYMWRSRELQGPYLGPQTGTHTFGVLAVTAARSL